MIHEYGNLFDSSAGYLAHGVNVCGVMGAGIAKTFRDKFPQNYIAYVEACEVGNLYPGGSLCVPTRLDTGRSVVVANLASQDDPGPNAMYEYLFASLLSFAEKASTPGRLKRYGGLVAIPEIGCGIGGLEWPKAQEILLCIERMFPEIEFEVWHYQA